jgi:hypothetical protein
LRKQLGKRGTTGRSAKIHFDLPTTVSGDFERALETKLIESTTTSWEFWFGLLETYKEKYGDCLVSDSHTTTAGYKLGRWIASQRSRKDRLTPERIQRLDDLGFVWDVSTAQWEQGFQALANYKQENGDCLVPSTYIAAGYKLGIWIANQRSTKGKLTPERIQRLSDLGFVWVVSTAQWEQGFQALANYKQENGDCLVPITYIADDGFKLGKWVSRRREEKAKSTPERIQRLDGLGFVWDVLTAQWEQGFESLSNYKRKNGDCLVPQKYITADGFVLGTWVATQRYTKDKLTPERIQHLDELGFVWKVINKDG